VAYDPAQWHEFFVMLGSAAAALAGLVFVGLSLHAAAVAKDAMHSWSARNLTAGILYVTVVCALMLTPGQPRWVLGVELIAGGLLIGAMFATPLVLFLPRLPIETKLRMTVAVCACVVSVYSGISLIAHAGGGLYLLVPAGIAGVTMNVFGAWSLLLGLARR
jgi:hypothetical protein